VIGIVWYVQTGYHAHHVSMVTDQTLVYAQGAITSVQLVIIMVFVSPVKF